MCCTLEEEVNTSRQESLTEELETRIISITSKLTFANKNVSILLHPPMAFVLAQAVTLAPAGNYSIYACAVTIHIISRAHPTLMDSDETFISGKGLRKGGAKCHRKILYDNIQALQTCFIVIILFNVCIPGPHQNNLLNAYSYGICDTIDITVPVLNAGDGIEEHPHMPQPPPSISSLSPTPSTANAPRLNTNARNFVPGAHKSSRV
ncbi:hypothetical protein P692DRAFT_201873088 [Suillus brevipes Sb2]|nr:hypothetical protein P692DRAFT_201873088 [Suillus brevipes Sb2]